MAVRWYVSSFGYAVTRPYPYKWFPWVVLIGGIFSLVLFSTINLAANGYELKVQYTTDPNSTVSQTPWANRWPFSWFSKMETTCQSQTLQINSQFYTDKLSLPYTLTGVWQYHTDENMLNQTAIPSLRYTNNVLENCTVTGMDIIIESLSNDGVSTKIEANIICSINNDGTPTWFNSTTSYDSFLHSDNKTKASLWWGQVLLPRSRANLAEALLENRIDNSKTEILLKGHFKADSDTSIFFPEGGPISSPFFFVESQLLSCMANYSGLLSGEYICSDTSNYVRNYLDDWPSIFPQADKYLKIFYSTILADMGSISLDNILTNASLLQEYTQYFSRTGTYNELKDSGIGPLEVTPSTIYAEYFCQVPQRKPVGPLIVAIVIADLVFLQAIYKILTWTTTAWTERNNQQAKVCEGCLANMERGPYELSLAAPTDAAQESLPVSSETWGRLALRSILEWRKSSESQQSLVLSPGLSE